MSLLKNWKLILATMSVAMFTACAGSNGGSDDGYDSEDGYEASDDSNGGSGSKAASKKKEPPKEVIDENKLKKAEQEATALTEDNHKLRKEIFDAKNKLGMSTAPAAEDAAAE